MDGQPQPFDLAALLDPIAPKDFFDQHWEQKPLHVRRDSLTHYASVLTGEDLDRILSTGDLRYPALQLARGGSYFPADAYTRDVKHGTEVFAGVPDLDKVITEYRSGTTIVLPALHRSSPPLGKACAALEAYFDHAVHANAYLTPGRAVGFSPHYDTHEVFVLQIAGRKHWRVYEPPLKLPHRTQPFSPIGYVLPPPLFELELLPGDLLYLPRGYVHSALTSESHSAHVTIGVTVYTWVELLSEVLNASKNSEGMRRALPPGFTSHAASSDALDSGLLVRLDALREGVKAGGAGEAFLRKVRAGRPRKEVTFDANVNVITLDATLRIDATDTRIEAGERGILVLHFDGKQLNLPGQLRITLEAMRARARFRLCDLPKDVDDNARLAFARFLEGEGFLVQVA
jgi:ribosomal protein L16 Arg81 hydroxylase